MPWSIFTAGPLAVLVAGLLATLPACGGSSVGTYSPAGASAGSLGSSGAGGNSGTGSTGAGSSGDGTIGSTGGATGGGTGGTGGSMQLGVTLQGDLAFPVLFAGEFYGALPDGGPDLSNLDCRISDGTDLGALCGPDAMPDSDAGVITSRQILDIYVTSVFANALTKGSAAVSSEYGDGGEFATIELTLCVDGGGWDFERANLGQVSYQATNTGIFGEFQAQFPGYPDGGGMLDGTFGAGYCGPLNGY